MRLDVAMYRTPGPDFHCAPWPDDIVLPGPHLYVRDLDGSWADASAPPFDPHASLPSDARDTGYTAEIGKVYESPDERSIYVVSATATERWPRERQVGCD